MTAEQLSSLEHMVYLDFSKAFDTVSHGVLQKLYSHDIDRCPLHRAKNWLDGQAWSIPQGSVLGPGLIMGTSPLNYLY